MTISDGLLWQADDQGRNWLRWAKRAGVTTLVAAVGLLLLMCGELVFGYLVAGGALVVAVAGVVYLLWDRTRFVELRLSEDSAPTLHLRMVTGRVVEFALEDVGRVELICTYGPYDPDTDGLNDSRTPDTVLLLNLRHKRGAYRSRVRGRLSAEEAKEICAGWERRCPQASVRREVRFRSSGTGD